MITSLATDRAANKANFMQSLLILLYETLMLERDCRSGAVAGRDLVRWRFWGHISAIRGS